MTGVLVGTAVNGSGLLAGVFVMVIVGVGVKGITLSVPSFAKSKAAIPAQ